MILVGAVKKPPPYAGLSFGNTAGFSHGPLLAMQRDFLFPHAGLSFGNAAGFISFFSSFKRYSSSRSANIIHERENQKEERD